MGWFITKRVDFDLEVENYEKACLADPQDDDAFYFLGTAYEDTGRYVDAISAYRKALVLNPSYKDAVHDLAILYLAVGKTDEAEELLPKLTALDKGWGNELRMLSERIKLQSPPTAR